MDILTDEELQQLIITLDGYNTTQFYEYFNNKYQNITGRKNYILSKLELIIYYLTVFNSCETEYQHNKIDIQQVIKDLLDKTKQHIVLKYNEISVKITKPDTIRELSMVQRHLESVLQYQNDIDYILTAYQDFLTVFHDKIKLRDIGNSSAEYLKPLFFLSPSISYIFAYFLTLIGTDGK